MRTIGRDRRKLSILVTALATSWATNVGSVSFTQQNVHARSAMDAYEECRALISSDPDRAIERCEEACRLDPTLPDPYFLLGSAHAQLGRENKGENEHRLKAAESYRKFLTLNRPDTEPRRRARVSALRGLLGISILDGARREDLEYANELAKESPLDRRDLLVLTAAYAQNSRPDLGEMFIKKQMARDPNDLEACQILGRLYNEPTWDGASRFSDSATTLEKCASLSPTDPTSDYILATEFWHEAYVGSGLDDPWKLIWVERGLLHVNKALSLKKDFYEALIYKGLLLHVKAIWTPDARERPRLMKESEGLQKQAIALKTSGVAPHRGLDTFLALAPTPTPRPASQPLPPPPPPPPARSRPRPVSDATIWGVAGVLPQGTVRAGGRIREATKIKNVAPIYPESAKQAGVQGIVILECRIDPKGQVTDARVLRGVPQLDDAAIDAVLQWVYEPTLVNGVPVNLIMTITVTFRLN